MLSTGIMDSNEKKVQTQVMQKLSADSMDVNKKKVQSQVTHILNKTNYSLNVVNRYKENIVHISAANDCIEILKCILKKYDKHCLERKNAFGWTPLMQAIRNENIETVKFLLSSGAIVNDFSFLGMSVLSLASAISNEMFDLVYNNCPSALEYAARDDINPLCVAALKNDKELFFKLIHLGLDTRKANAFTHVMMKRSKVPEIAALAKSHLSAEDYWSDLSDIEDVLKDDDESMNNADRVCSTDTQFNGHSKTYTCIPKICIEKVELTDTQKPLRKENLFLNLESSETKSKSKNLISPTLSYFNESSLPMSPNIFIAEDDPVNTFSKLVLDINETENIKMKDASQSPKVRTEDLASISPLVLQRCQSKRPPNLKLRNSSNDSNATLTFTPQFSPSKTPNLPHDINEDNVFNETTPTPPKYKTPPRGIMLDPSTKKLMYLLQRFGLKRHISTFLEQEVDLDLFLTLTDKDLIEIGIDSKSERLILLSVINECKGNDTKFF